MATLKRLRFSKVRHCRKCKRKHPTWNTFREAYTNVAFRSFERKARLNRAFDAMPPESLSRRLTPLLLESFDAIYHRKYPERELAKTAAKLHVPKAWLKSATYQHALAFGDAEAAGLEYAEAMGDPLVVFASIKEWEELGFTASEVEYWRDVCPRPSEGLSQEDVDWLIAEEMTGHGASEEIDPPDVTYNKTLAISGMRCHRSGMAPDKRTTAR